ncbi:MAG: ABC transporter permease [Acidimicrobiia bacterium]
MTARSVGAGGWSSRLLAAHTWAVYLFFYLPIALLVVFSFGESRLVGVMGGLSLRWYRQMLANDQMWAAVGNSLTVAFWSTAVSTVLGTAAALSLERFRYRGRRAFDGLLYLPIIIPDIAMAVMLLLFFVQITQPVGLGLGIGSITLSHIAFNISFVAVVVRARLAGLDPALEEAAADLYAGRWQAFRRVTLPLILPGVLGGALLALTLSLDDVVITSFVTGVGSTTLPVYVFGLVKRGVTPMINAISTLMLVASMVLVLASLVVQRRR